jgi:putative transposase
VKFAFIREKKVAFHMVVLCRVQAVSPSGHYASLSRPVPLHARRDEELLEQIKVSHHASMRRYESPRVHTDLNASGGRRSDESEWQV